jgi:DNA-binding Lrp family transcriptional regulator
LGFNARAKIMLKTKKEFKHDLKNYLTINQNINSIYKINNGYDYMIECIFKNMKELEDFIEAIDDKFGLEKKATYYIIDDIKREQFLSDPELLPMGV